MVRTTIDVISGDAAGVLETVERVTQQVAAGIGLAVMTGVIDYVSTSTLADVVCPGSAINGDHDDDAHGADTTDGEAVEHAVRFVAKRPKTVRTLLGTVSMSRSYYYCRDCHQGFAPFDAILGVIGTSLSPGLQRACALAGAEMPYATSHEVIRTVTGLDLTSTSTVARTTRTQGARARAIIDAEHAAAGPGPAAGVITGGPDKCYIVVDGTGAPMLPKECQGRKGKNGERAGTREVKIGCFFTQSGLDPATNDPVQDTGSASYISTFAPAAGFATQVTAEYHRREFDQIRQPVILGDGAIWIWNIADDQFPQATQIVDYFHAREHLAELTKLVTDLVTDRDQLEQQLVDCLDLGDTNGINTVVESLPMGDLHPDIARAVVREVAYFTKNHHRMQYAEFKANGYYIGSGPVESACNTIVKQRAKRAGMHWSIEGLDPVLALRTLHQSRRDDALWPTPQT